MDHGFSEKYARCITRHPYLVLLLVILVSVFAVQMALTVETKMFVVKDLLPPDEEVMSTLEIIEDNFGNVDTVFFAVAVNPSHQGSDEVRDIRDARVVQYLDQISELALHTEDVAEVRSPSHILRTMNDGRLPQSTREIRELSHKNGLLTGYFSQDHDLARVRILIDDDADLEELETELTKILAQVPRPPGVEVSLGGTAIESMVMEKTIPTDMARTTTASLFGIVVIVLVLFRSVKYGFLPLSAIAFGSIWAMGFVGLIGMELSAATAGVLSIIMGIGIDFGIQVATRYRLELHTKKPEDAMEQTLRSVIIPMSITASAAVIGFQAMSLGRLGYLGEMGSIMSYGVAASMLAALTAVPALIIIFDTVDLKILIKKLNWRYKYEQET